MFLFLALACTCIFFVIFGSLFSFFFLFPHCLFVFGHHFVQVQMAISRGYF